MKLRAFLTFGAGLILSGFVSVVCAELDSMPKLGPKPPVTGNLSAQPATVNLPAVNPASTAPKQPDGPKEFSPNVPVSPTVAGPQAASGPPATPSTNRPSLWDEAPPGNPLVVAPPVPLVLPVTKTTNFWEQPAAAPKVNWRATPTLAPAGANLWK